jgi:hypothetical protein
MWTCLPRCAAGEELCVCCRGIGVTIVCPGPVAPPVGAASPRSLYGPKGAIQRQEVPDSKRMPASRAALLIANAMAAGVSECWLARQPVLLMGECCVYGDVGRTVIRLYAHPREPGQSCILFYTVHTLL